MKQYPRWKFNQEPLVCLSSGTAGLVVWSLASGAQGPRINTWLGRSWLGQD